jgi:hypothetical protein
MAIKDRKLTNVTVENVDFDWFPDGEHTAGGMCHITLSNQDGGIDGPGANIFFSVPVDPNMPLRDVSRAMLTRAHEILQRMASFSLNELEGAFVEWRKNAVQQEKEAAALGVHKTERN